MNRIIIIVSLLFLALSIEAQVNIIPKPVSATVGEGSFVFDAKTKILYAEKDQDMKRLATFLSRTIAEQTGVVLKMEPLRKQKIENVFVLQTGQLQQTNAYTLDVQPKSVTLTGQSPQSVFYGIQTIRQLLPSDKKAPRTLTVVRIEDYPRFEWRGMLQDPCRHIFTVDYIKGLIDEMAYYKLNKLHWHLTDDQGWRIEIKKYPRLAEISAWRNGSQYGRDRKKDVDDIRYGGFYTQEQIKEVVAYAAERYIEVIPEIEMPGHSVAAITAYNYLACNEVSFETGQPFEVRKVWGVSKDLLCAGNEQVFGFIEDVLTEVMTLFPSQYIHVGGDEAPHDAWKICPKCQKRIKDEGLKDEAELQSYFIRRIEKFLNAKGKRLIGWEEIMQGGLTPNATVMSWLGTASGVAAARDGHQVIMCPYSHMYIDAYQASSDIEPFAIGYFAPLEKTYSFEPYDPALKENEKPYIIGVQGNLWTEFISNPQVAQYMLYPKICALSEIAWSPQESKNWGDFKVRLSHEMLRFQRAGINYRIPTPEAPSHVFIKEGETVELANSWGWGEIHYTTDGTEPTLQSALYTKPIAPEPGSVIRSAVFLPNGARSSVWNTLIRVKSERENLTQ